MGEEIVRHVGYLTYGKGKQNKHGSEAYGASPPFEKVRSELAFSRDYVFSSIISLGSC